MLLPDPYFATRDLLDIDDGNKEARRHPRAESDRTSEREAATLSEIGSTETRDGPDSSSETRGGGREGRGSQDGGGQRERSVGRPLSAGLGRDRKGDREFERTRQRSSVERKLEPNRLHHFCQSES